MSQADPQDAQFRESLGRGLVQTSKAHINLGQDFIVTTEDRLRLCLANYMESLKQQTGWITPVSLFCSFILCFATSKFQDKFGFQAATWEAFFFLCAIASVIWGVVAIIKALLTKATVDTIVRELKKKSTEEG
jgi:hypothetical protein